MSSSPRGVLRGWLYPPGIICINEVKTDRDPGGQAMHRAVWEAQAAVVLLLLQARLLLAALRVQHPI